MSVQELARAALTAYVQDKRDNGEEFWKHDGEAAESPEAHELAETCAKAGHADSQILPDDWRYEFVVDALVALGVHEDSEEAMESIEADIATSELTRWLHSRNDRVAYLDEAAEFGATLGDGGGFRALQQAQWLEKREVFEAVLGVLQKAEH